MLVVSDTSPISNLFMVGRLEILPALFDEIVIPPAVMREVLALESSGWDLSPIKNAAWLKTIPASDQMAVQALMQTLHRGESEALVLAQELNADYLLMDEALGRKTAEMMGVKIIGLLGVLLEAKTEGLISAVKPIMDDLIQVAKFRVREALYQQVLERAGE